MPKLTQDINRHYELGDISEHPVLGGELIYQGAAVGLEVTGGHARTLSPTDKFLGFAEDHIDAVNLNDGEKRVRVKKKGAVLLDIPNSVLTDVNKAVYATEDNSFTLLASENAVYIGQISRIEASGKAIVEFDVAHVAP